MQFFAGNIVAERFAICQLTSTQLDIFYLLLNSKLKWFEVSPLMAAIAERLFKAEATTAPPIHLIKNSRILDFDGPRYRRNRLQSLRIALARILLFYFSFNFDVEMRLILVVERYSGILWLDDPALGRNMFDFFEEIATPTNQHHYYYL